METDNFAVSRREALIKLLRVAGAGAGAAGLGLWLSEHNWRPETALAMTAKHGHLVAADPKFPKMAIIQGGEPIQLARQAIEELGGMHRFIARGDVVLVKPNIGWDRTPEQAANTNPDLVAEIVRQCSNAGAKRVIVTDVSCNDPRRCFQRSGIAEAAKLAGADVILPEPSRFKDVDLQGEVLHAWPVFDPFLNVDKVINIPIAKHHGLTGTTLGMKNWYGMLGGQRNQLHQKIHESLGGSRRFCAADLDHHRLLPDSRAQRTDRGQSRRCTAQEDAGCGNRSGGPRRLRGEGLLEHGS